MAIYITSNSEAYSKMMEELAAAKNGGESGIGEYQQAVSLYSPGGAYGEGAKAVAVEQAKKNLAATNANLVNTGMSSGSLAAGVRARYSKDLTTTLQGIEDVRYERLGTALQALGAAKEARGLRATQTSLSAASLYSGASQTQSAENVARLNLAGTIVQANKPQYVPEGYKLAPDRSTFEGSFAP
jgi:hypothetical protein